MDVLAARSGGLAVQAVVALLSLASLAVRAQDAALAGGSPPRAGGAGRLELSASSVPQFDSGAARSSRLDMLWLPPRHPSLGLALGLVSQDTLGFAPMSGTGGPSVDLGVHWRYGGEHRIDVTAWRRMAASDNASGLPEPTSSYGARLEMRMKSASARQRFGFDRGLLGLQLEGGGRIGVRRTGGHPMIYYRTSF